MWTLCFLIIALPVYFIYTICVEVKKAGETAKREEKLKPMREWEDAQKTWANNFRLSDREETILKEGIIEGKYDEKLKEICDENPFLKKLNLKMDIKIQLLALENGKLHRYNTTGQLSNAGDIGQRESIEYIFFLHHEMQKHGLKDKLYVRHNGVYYTIGVGDIEMLQKHMDYQFYWKSTIPSYEKDKISTRPFALRNL